MPVGALFHCNEVRPHFCGLSSHFSALRESVLDRGAGGVEHKIGSVLRRWLRRAINQFGDLEPNARFDELPLLTVAAEVHTLKLS